ncbi:MAG: hypothetical protein AAF724_08340 [Pseudomonadota bacterium]
MRATYLKTGIAAGFALLVSTHASVALDADEFAKKFVAAYTSGGMTVAYEGVSEQGNDIIMQGLTFGVEGEQTSFDFGDLTFSGVSEDGSGGYLVDTVSKDRILFSAPEVSFTLDDMSITNLRVPAEAKMETLDDALYYDSLTTGPMKLTAEGQDVFSIASISMDLSKASDNSRMDFTGRADGLEIDLSSVEDAQTRQTLSGMGYQFVGGDVVLEGYWLPTTGEMTLSQYALSLDGVGRLDMQVSISGYTFEFVRGIQELQEKMDDQGNDSQAQQAMGLAMLGMLQQLTFNSLSIRFDDASVTNKVLEMVASRQGMTRDQMVQGLQAMVPFALAQLQNPDFQKNVTEAVSLYLSDPKNIEISAMPAEPLSFASVVGTAMSAWQTLPQMLNVSVTANQ